MIFTVVVVAVQVLFTDQQVVVFVQFPEFTVNDVEVFVREVVFDEIDVFFGVERLENGQKVGFLQFG